VGSEMSMTKREGWERKITREGGHEKSPGAQQGEREKEKRKSRGKRKKETNRDYVVIFELRRYDMAKRGKKEAREPRGFTTSRGQKENREKNQTASMRTIVSLFSYCAPSRKTEQNSTRHRARLATKCRFGEERSANTGRKRR